METTDDPVTMGYLASTVAISGSVYAMTQASKKASKAGGGQSISADMAGVTAGQPTKTATPTASLSEQAKKNRRLAASALTREFAEPTLGTPSLLGV